MKPFKLFTFITLLYLLSNVSVNSSYSQDKNIFRDEMGKCFIENINIFYNINESSIFKFFKCDWRSKLNEYYRTLRSNLISKNGIKLCKSLPDEFIFIYTKLDRAVNYINKLLNLTEKELKVICTSVYENIRYDYVEIPDKIEFNELQYSMLTYLDGMKAVGMYGVEYKLYPSELEKNKNFLQSEYLLFQSKVKEYCDLDSWLVSFFNDHVDPIISLLYECGVQNNSELMNLLDTAQILGKSIVPLIYSTYTLSKSIYSIYNSIRIINSEDLSEDKKGCEYGKAIAKSISVLLSY